MISEKEVNCAGNGTRTVTDLDPVEYRIRRALLGQNTLVGSKMQPLLIVLDKAYIYCRGEGSICSRTVQVIVKEGRK